jgi:hypothetical protein
VKSYNTCVNEILEIKIFLLIRVVLIVSVVKLIMFAGVFSCWNCVDVHINGEKERTFMTIA